MKAMPSPFNRCPPQRGRKPSWGLPCFGLLAVLTVAMLPFAAVESAAPPHRVGAQSRLRTAWPMLGGTPERNLVNPFVRGLPSDWSVKKGKVRNVKWAARLGSHSLGSPVIAGGRVFIGTNNEVPRDKGIKGDRGVLMCFREADGAFLWQAVHEKAEDVDVDFPLMGVVSTPCVESDRLYYVSNRGELICAHVAGDAKTGKAKILWSYDMVKQLGVFPCQLPISSPLVVGDLVYVVTGNGVDVATGRLPAPKAASFIAVHKRTGRLVWQSSLPGKNVMRGQWSSPSACTINGRTQVIFPGGDGWLYAFAAGSHELLWKFDLNPKKAGPYKYGGRSLRCFPFATPVVSGGRCYIAAGQEPDEGPGVGHLWCIDITKAPKNKNKDLSPVNDNFDPKAPVNKDSGLVWHYGGPVIPKPKGDDEREDVFGRTLSSMLVHDGLVYAAEIAGYLHCVDAKTGKKVWEHDFQDGTWCSPYYVDGKVFLGTDGSDLLIYKAGRKLVEPKKIKIGQPVKVPPVAANGVLYVNAGTHLYAIARPR
jgi:outer membrane protein assembly factor BamB